MSVLPVIKGDPPLPLLITSESQIVPAVAEDPCACCGSPTYDHCTCTCYWITQSFTQATITIANTQDGYHYSPSPPAPDPVSYYGNYSALNGTYVLSISGALGELYLGTHGDAGDRGVEFAYYENEDTGYREIHYLYAITGQILSDCGWPHYSTLIGFEFKLQAQMFGSDGTFLGSYTLVEGGLGTDDYITTSDPIDWDEDCAGEGVGPRYTYFWTEDLAAGFSITVNSDATAVLECSPCGC